MSIKTIINDVNIPVIGLGTFPLKGKQAIEIVKKAIQMGYTHIDTAEAYDNEQEIGEALKDFDRKKLFITSKVRPDNLHYQSVINSCKESLKKLNSDYLNLYLVHWPNPSIDMKETFQAFKELYSKGLIKAIGVSNFTIKRLKQAIPICQSLLLNIAVNQVEFNPLLYQEELLDFCRKNNIYITAYRPIIMGAVGKLKIISEIANKYNKTPAQITLRWLIQQEVIAIPKTSSEKHLRENLNIFDFELDQCDIEEIKKVNHNLRMINNEFPDFLEEY